MGPMQGAFCWLCVPGAIIPFYNTLMNLFFSSSLIKNLLQSSASRKTQKKKKKKVSHWAVGLMEKNPENVPLINSFFFFFFFKASKNAESATGQAMETEAAE